MNYRPGLGKKRLLHKNRLPMLQHGNTIACLDRKIFTHTHTHLLYVGIERIHTLVPMQDKSISIILCHTSARVCVCAFCNPAMYLAVYLPKTYDVVLKHRTSCGLNMAVAALAGQVARHRRKAREPNWTWRQLNLYNVYIGAALWVCVFVCVWVCVWVCVCGCVFVWVGLRCSSRFWTCINRRSTVASFSATLHAGAVGQALWANYGWQDGRRMERKKAERQWETMECKRQRGRRHAYTHTHTHTHTCAHTLIHKHIGTHTRVREV